MTFENGVVLVGAPNDLRGRVHIRSEEADRPGVDINEAVQQL